MEVYDSEGNITNNTNTVLNTCKSEFNELYKGYENIVNFIQTSMSMLKQNGLD